MLLPVVSDIAEGVFSFQCAFTAGRRRSRRPQRRRTACLPWVGETPRRADRSRAFRRGDDAAYEVDRPHLGRSPSYRQQATARSVAATVGGHFHRYDVSRGGARPRGRCVGRPRALPPLPRARPPPPAAPCRGWIPAGRSRAPPRGPSTHRVVREPGERPSGAAAGAPTHGTCKKNRAAPFPISHDAQCLRASSCTLRAINSEASPTEKAFAASSAPRHRPLL